MHNALPLPASPGPVPPSQRSRPVKEPCRGRRCRGRHRHAVGARDDVGFRARGVWEDVRSVFYLLCFSVLIVTLTP